MQNPYFYCEGGNEALWRDVAEHIGAELHAAGRLVDPTPRTIPPAEYGDLFVRGVRASPLAPLILSTSPSIQTLSLSSRRTDAGYRNANRGRI